MIFEVAEKYFLVDKIIFLFFAGIFLGGAFISRYQIGIMILFFFIWSYIYKKFSLKELILIASGIILTILLEIIINSWGYNNNNYFPKSTLVYSNYFPYLNYVYYVFFGVNIFPEGNPWWQYFFLTINKFFPPLSIVVMLCFFYLWIF